MSYRKWVAVAIVLFVGGLVLGLVAPSWFSSFISRELAELERLGQSLAPFTLTTFAIIFGRNALALLASFIFSPILLLPPILSLVLNGLVLSFVSATIAREYSILFVLGGLLPHGIIEIPALVIGQAAALGFGTATLMAIFGKEKKGRFWSGLRQYAKYLAIAIGLLLPAAAIETYVTPLLLGR